MQMYPGWSARDNYAQNKKKKRKRMEQQQQQQQQKQPQQQQQRATVLTDGGKEIEGEKFEQFCGK